MDPKIVVPIAVAALSAFGWFCWRMGKRAARGYVSAELEQLHRDLEAAHATPDPGDDAAVEAKIRAKERLRGALDALPDTM